MNWQPIETASKTSANPVVVWDTHYNTWSTARYSVVYGIWEYDEELLNDINPEGPKPTHWLPINPPN